ncbi:MAG: TonB-dependent receptor [Methylotenera sp.]|nr:TonB-dependent receptor [Methylotenera sp.]
MRAALQHGFKLSYGKSLHNPIYLSILAMVASSPAFAEDLNTEIDLPSVSVTGNPLGVSSDELIVPVTTLNGRELSLKRESTLGDTLDGIPGVSATHFGPNASRPVIRGLDAERVRIMQNGVGVLDASSLSFDHAVTVAPIIVEQVDVIRGPAALLYGGSAVGGVVNAMDNRIPTEQLNSVTGRAETRVGGPDSQNNIAGVVDAGNGLLAIHGDLYSRKTSDLDIPGYAVSKRKSEADGTPRINKGKLINSSADGDGGAIGASLTFDSGYIGASYSGFNSNYGTVAEPDVRIDMQSQRWDIASEFHDLDKLGFGNLINRMKFRLAHTDYEHQELENGEVGTTFKNRGIEGSLEAGHTPIHTGIGNLNGVIGLQFQNTTFEALGEEAFVPSSNTQTKALYIYEELPLNSIDTQKFKLSFGGRTEHTSVDSSDNFIFGPGQTHGFNPTSYAIGGIYTLTANWSLASNLSHNERAPSYFELYANGAHLATGQFEVGNNNFDVERSNGIDAQIRWKDAKNSFSVGTYYTRFSSFLGLLETGNSDAGSGLPIAQFSAFAADFKGFEAEGKFNVASNLDLTLRGDYVHATNRDNGDALPRIAPLRLGAGLHYQKGSFGARLDMLHAFGQNRTAANELETNSYTDVSALISYKLPTKLNMELFAKANNLLNDAIREHASFLKDIAPQGERSVLIGLRTDF